MRRRSSAFSVCGWIATGRARIHRTRQPTSVPRLTQGWRELTLYRAVPQNGDLTVTFALTGIGEAWIDDLAVSLMDPEPVRAP